MRDYAKVSPTFWTGETGKAIRARGSNAMLVAVYLMTSPHANMLGLYYQPILFMGHETGLGLEGARKGLASCIEAGFCHFDAPSEMVWVPEMATYQIAKELKASDNRCAGIQKEYDSLPKCPFLVAFYDRYARQFHLTTRREFVPASSLEAQAPSKPLRSQEQEQEQEKEQDQENPLTPKGALRGFAEFWAFWPKSTRKGGKGDCEKVWKAKSLEAEAEAILAHVKAMAATEGWRKDAGKFIPAPVVYLRGKRWDGAEMGGPGDDMEAEQARRDATTAEAARRLFGTQQGEVFDA